MKKVLLSEFSALELKNLMDKKEKLTAICAFGSLESHGWHCPLGTDTFIPTEAAILAAQRLDNTLVVPLCPLVLQSTTTAILCL